MIKITKKSISPIISILLVVAIATVMIISFTTFTKDSTKRNLDESTKDLKKASDLSCQNLNLKIKSCKIDYVSKDVEVIIANPSNIKHFNFGLTLQGRDENNNQINYFGRFNEILDKGETKSFSTDYAFSEKKDGNIFLIENNKIDNFTITSGACPNYPIDLNGCEFVDNYGSTYTSFTFDQSKTIVDKSFEVIDEYSSNLYGIVEYENYYTKDSNGDIEITSTSSSWNGYSKLYNTSKKGIYKVNYDFNLINGYAYFGFMLYKDGDVIDYDMPNIDETVFTSYHSSGLNYKALSDIYKGNYSYISYIDLTDAPDFDSVLLVLLSKEGTSSPYIKTNQDNIKLEAILEPLNLSNKIKKENYEVIGSLKFTENQKNDENSAYFFDRSSYIKVDDFNQTYDDGFTFMGWVNLEKEKPLKVASGIYSNCVLVEGGDVYCYGRNYDGQLGNGREDVDSKFPTKSLIKNARDIVGGNDTFCVYLEDSNSAKCFGEGYYGNIRYDISRYKTPVFIEQENIKKIKPSNHLHTCSIDTNDDLYCFGYNTYGAIGNGTIEYRVRTPYKVLSNVKDFGLGRYHTCAVLMDGSVKCWGQNDYGQLGTGDTNNYYSPVDVNLTSTKYVLDSLEKNKGIATNIFLNNGVLNNSFEFNGTTSYVNLGDIDELDTASDFSVSFWFKRNQSQSDSSNHGTHNVMFSQGSDSYNDNIEIGSDGNNIDIYLDSSNSDQLISYDLNILDNQWYFFTLTYDSLDSNEVKLYLDGNKVIEASNWGGNLDSSDLSELTIGNTTHSDIYYNGLMDEVGIWDRKLSDNEVYDLYNSGNALDYNTQIKNHSTLNNEIISYWNLNDVNFTNKKVQKITGGYRHTCTLLENGTVQCFGYGYHGELGQGDDVVSYTPVEVLDLENAEDVFTSHYYTSYAKLEDGTYKCWGSNGYNQCNPNYGSEITSAVDYGYGDNNILDLSAGYYNSTFVDSNNNLKTVGYDYSYNVKGNDLSRYYQGLFKVPGIKELNKEIKTISSANNTTNILFEDGSIYGFGRNIYGELGDGTRDNKSYVVKSYDIDNVVDIKSNHMYSSCVLLDNGNVKCWGYNNHGGLGDGTTTYAYNEPVDTLISDVVSLKEGYYGYCALLDNSKVKCWGYNGYGAFGNGYTSSRETTPIYVFNEQDNIVDFSIGRYHMCILLDNGDIKCSGRNHVGQLGDGTTTDSYSPVDVNDIDNAIAIESGLYYNCALLDTGKVKCWGYNAHKNCGETTETHQYTPYQIPDLNNVVKIKSKYLRSCAKKENEEIYCWGNLDQGELANGIFDYDSPVRKSEIDSIDKISFGNSHTCFLKDSEFYCSGDNYYGALGLGFNSEKIENLESVFSGYIFGKDRTQFAIASHFADYNIQAFIGDKEIEVNLGDDWHHIIFTYDKQNIKFFIDGVLYKQIPYSQPIFIKDDYLNIGESFYGSLSDIRFYRKGLTQKELESFIEMYDFSKS